MPLLMTTNKDNGSGNSDSGNNNNGGSGKDKDKLAAHRQQSTNSGSRRSCDVFE
jgi:hypothetical protein